jgi:hypothetical protein
MSGMPEVRGVGLRTTQYSLLRELSRTGEVRQGVLCDKTNVAKIKVLTRTSETIKSR